MAPPIGQKAERGKQNDLISPGAKRGDCNQRAEQPWDAKSISETNQIISQKDASL